MSIMVTGGAGYVGSVVTERLLTKGFQVVVVDNLQQGHRKAVLPEAKFENIDLANIADLDRVFSQYKIEAVMHMAAETLVAYSMTDPKRYFQANIVCGLNLLDTMLKHGVRKIVFSSSAATYGESNKMPIEEEHPKLPMNAYGESKLMFERILEWYRKAYDFECVSMRYFNAAGSGDIVGEDHHPETHLIPNVLRAALDKNAPVSVFGTDYPTPDGTCIRDYVHVKDIADAHILSLVKIKNVSGEAFNLGSENGYSILEVIDTASKVTGLRIPRLLKERRPGDPSKLVASSKKAKTKLGWDPQYSTIEPILRDAWQWMKKHPSGYDAQAR